MNYIYAAAGAIIALFVVQILRKKSKATADFLLVGVNVMIGFFMLADVLLNWRLTSGTVIFQNAVPLFLFPTFVFYLLQFTHANKQIKWQWWLMFVPGLVMVLVSLVDHFLLNNYPQQTDVWEHFNAPAAFYQVMFKGSQLLFIAILLDALRGLKRFEEELKTGHSSIETINLKWLRNFTLIYLGSLVMTFLLFLGQNLGILPFEIEQVFGIVYGILVLSVFYLNYHGIQHYALSQVDLDKRGKQEAKTSQPLQQKAAELTDAEREIEAKMLHLIESQQLYLEPKFSLGDLANSLEQNKHLVSRIINAKEGRSFYDLINGYRVAHLQRLLDDPANSNFTILALGLESGFNSKASLNRIFKLVSGLTPKQYLDSKSQSIE